MVTRRERNALRARAATDPSDLLVLHSLAAHRVLDTHQLARLLGRAQGTVEWRLRRLRAAGLVACTRPPRLSGSAPLHFWLTASGHRLIGSEGPARDPDTPNVLFLAHTTAVVGLALALRGAPGLTLAAWRREQEAWEWWRITASGYFGGPREGDEWKLRPDALAVLGTAAGAAHAFVEVDRGTMSHTRLRTKLTGYLRYAADRGWEGRHPFCPPLLFLTCSEDRAARVVADALALREGREAGRGWMAGGRARELVVASCGLVDHPDAAVAAVAWRTDDGRGPLALAPLVGACAESAAAARAAERAESDAADAAAVARDRDAAWVTLNLDRDALRDPLLSDALALLADDRAWREREPGLADALADWQRGGRGPMGAPLEGRLRRFADERRAEHVAAAVAGRDLGLPADLAVLRLARGGLALADPHLPYRDAGRAEAVAKHAEERGRWVRARLARMGALRRLRADEAALADEYDADRLVVCADCGAERRKSPERPPCPRCGCRHVRPWSERARVPTVPDRLAALRAADRYRGAR
jgi:hypothetical protein